MHGYCNKCVNIHNFRKIDVEDFWDKMCKICYFLHFPRFTASYVNALRIVFKPKGTCKQVTTYKRRQQAAATQNTNSTISRYTKRTVTQQGRRTQIKYKTYPYLTPLWTETQPPYAAENTVNSRTKNLKIRQSISRVFNLMNQLFPLLAPLTEARAFLSNMINRGTPSQSTKTHL